MKSHRLLPYWQAAKTKQPIDVSITLMDNQTVSLPLDSTSTSAEVCQALADKINLQDTYGFSLYISLYDKVSFSSIGKVERFSKCWNVISIMPYHHCFHTYIECCLITASTPDVVSGQLWEACVGCSVSVRAGDEEAGQGGEERPVEALHPQGNVHTLAWLLSGPDQHRSNLQAGHQGDQVGRVHQW